MKLQKGDSRVEFVFFMIGMIIFSAFVGYNMLFRDSAYRAEGVAAAEAENFEQVTVQKTNYWFGAYFTGCARDTVAVHMRAKNLSGKEVPIVACMGQYFGKAVIRHE